MTENQRTTYGETLVELGATNKDIVVLDADLSKSTMGCLFEAEYPNRFYEMGIAEANMASVAAGLSLTGKTPFFASFAVFCPGRCYDQIRTSICIPSLNVKVCGSSAGLSDFGDGSTHQAIDDIALMKNLPNMQVFSPADSIETAKIVRYMADNKGPMYIRLNRNPLPFITDEKTKFVPGDITVMKDTGDVAIFATGIMVSKAIEAAKILKAEKNMDVKVVNVPSIKPINAKQVLDVVRSVKAIVTAEEHSIYGGLGDVIAKTISGEAPVKHVRMGVKDSFGSSAQDYDTLLAGYGLTSDEMVKIVLSL